jgi:predicted nucleic-acid-binding Zn-ribbon protein
MPSYPSNSKYCPNCGNVDIPKNAVKGSTGVEILLWIFFIIPGLIYSMWRSSTRHAECSQCGYENIVPLTSPVAIRAFREQGIYVEIDDEDTTIFREKAWDIAKFVIVIALVIVAITVFR